MGKKMGSLARAPPSERLGEATQARAKTVIVLRKFGDSIPVFETLVIDDVD